MSIVSNAEINSRAYAFVYPIRGPEHLPPDFPVDLDPARLVSGIFLPQEQSGWFHRPSYPAHVLCLMPDELFSVAHPLSGEQVVRLSLRDIVAIESSRIMLDGRLTIYTLGSGHLWRYNTRDARHVDEFLFDLRRATMLEPEAMRRCEMLIFGEPLDLKFTMTESRELDPGERRLARIFIAPKLEERRSWVFGTDSWTPGEYLAMTSRRILWISDRGNDVPHCRTTTTYAAADRISDIGVTYHEERCVLNISLSSHVRWRIPVAQHLHEEAASFVDCVRTLRSWHKAESQS